MKHLHQPHTPHKGKIIVRGKQKQPLDIDLLVEALLLIAEQLQLQQEAEDFARSLAEDDELT